MLAFEGPELPGWVADRLAAAPAAGMTVFRHHNVRSPDQLRDLTESFQRAGAGFGADSPMLVAADVEGGQLQALGDAVTPFAGNMALDAVGDPDLAERVAFALGLEARAMGVNVAYAPALDLASEPANVALGIRSFGDDPAVVGRLGAAMVGGFQAAGVAATVKHFPGLGSVREDTHHGLGVVSLERGALERGPLAPFRAAIAAGTRLVMSAHVAVPAVTGDASVPATLAPAVMHDLLRGELGFEGVTISDALDMRALAQGEAQADLVRAAVNAGVDLLLCAADRDAIARIERALADGAAARAFDADGLAAAAVRVTALRSWLGAQAPAPDLSVVGCADHRALSREVARRSLTLVRGDPTLPPGSRILSVMPQPTDLTPADTSSTVAPGLGAALRRRFEGVDEIVVGIDPSEAEIAAVRARAGGVDAVVAGTIEGFRFAGQARLVEALVATGRPTIAVALRTPWDVRIHPAQVAAAVCTYSILPDSLDALAAGLAGELPFTGRVPVALG
jgi:beta-N-acetylhexosaminidase